MVAQLVPQASPEKAGPAGTAPDPLVISAIGHDEVDAVAAFYAGFENEKRPLSFWQDRLRLWWHENPAFQPGWHHGVKMTSGGRMVGVLSAVPVRIRSGGSEAVGASLTTWRVEKDHRAGSIGMFEAVLAAHAGRPVFDSTPTQGVIRLLKHYGFDRPRTHLPAARLLCNGWTLLARACGAASASLGSSLFFVNARPAGLEEAATLVDDLWSHHPAPFDEMGVKDGAYFRWYCREGRSNGRFGLVVTDAAGRPAGMAICLDMGNGVAWLVDMWCDFSSPEAAAQLVSQARWHATRLGFHCLWVPHFQPVVAAACGRVRTRGLPVNAFFKLPAREEGSRSSHWTIAVGDFGI